jgi:cytochrome c oxidase subunit 2
MAVLKRLMLGLAGLVAASAAWSTAWAAAPEPWQVGLQEAATPIMEHLNSFHNLLLVIIIGISVFVLMLLLFVVWRFSEKRNPTPSKTTHHTLIEVIWTVAPVLILVVIAIPSFRLLYFMDHVEDAEMTIKATGRQWYWSYEYPDNGDFTFDAFMIPESDLQPGQKRLLDTDTKVVLPVDTTIRVLVTASDVLHSFAVPAFGIKIDAVPGRINETWVRIPAEFAGTTFYGQCSELCGTGHAHMPIAIEAVSKQEFETWVAEAQQRFAGAGSTPEAPRAAATEASEDKQAFAALARAD